MVVYQGYITKWHKVGFIPFIAMQEMERLECLSFANVRNGVVEWARAPFPISEDTPC